MNSSSNSCSSISSSGSWFQATTGDSNGGVSEISKSSSLRSGLFDHSQIAITFNLIPTFEMGVAVMIRSPKINIAIRSGYASKDVISATSGFAIQYPSKPPPSRIAVAPVGLSAPSDPLSRCARPVVLTNKVSVPIVMRPVTWLSSGFLKSLKAKYRSARGVSTPTRPKAP
ncbi:unannotated protein [freshwater metagenome]|uniref:Unannotated protein n=1 Tax=freshwater metagenome TaxID=449393 RepID=A0A6J6BIM1_9ZZZZ